MRARPLNKTLLLFFIILIEGYVVLACELLAIRQLIPFVGSGTETISIIISAVLLPLAIGYHFGGRSFKTAYHKARLKGKERLSVRKILLRNIISSLAILSLGLSYVFLEIFFPLIETLNIHNRLLQTALFSSLFLVTPVFLLGQTVPLVSNYFSRAKLSEITGKMLFFSTTGSFLGSVFSTIILMTFIGVHYTVIITLSLLAVLALLLSRRLLSYEPFFCLFILSLLFMMNNNSMMQMLHIVSDNNYNLVRIIDVPKDEARILEANRSWSSKVSKDPKNNFVYWNYIQKMYIDPIMQPGSAPKDILIIGAGGFTIGLPDKINHYVFVDIDPALKDISEKYFLKEKLSPNKHFAPASARAFVRGHDKKYDFILLDAYTNVISLPMEVTTREFLLDTKKLLKDNGILIANIISSPTFQDRFSVRYHNTFASVFPIFSRQIIVDYDGWEPAKDFATMRKQARNVLYIYYNNTLMDDRVVYTDDRNTYSLDR
jgi:hypothetical protein